jgi:hypothetical protein
MLLLLMLVSHFLSHPKGGVFVLTFFVLFACLRFPFPVLGNRTGRAGDLEQDAGAMRQARGAASGFLDPKESILQCKYK